MNSLKLSELELDILLLCYWHSDQYGIVDMNAVVEDAWVKLKVVMPRDQIVIHQKHIDALIDRKILPDSNSIISKIKKIKSPNSKE